jgi:hypothetical protein
VRAAFDSPTPQFSILKIAAFFRANGFSEPARDNPKLFPDAKSAEYQVEDVVSGRGTGYGIERTKGVVKIEQ